MMNAQKRFRRFAKLADGEEMVLMRRSDLGANLRIRTDAPVQIIKQVNHLAHIKHNDRVTVRNRQGQEQTGRAIGLLRGPNHIMLSDPKKRGGGNGIIATNENIVRCAGCKRG